MNCNEARERINDYVDGHMSSSERAVLLAHFAECASCREEEMALRGLLSEARGLERNIMPREDLWKGISERIVRPEEKANAPYEVKWRVRTVMWLSAAVILAFLCAAVLALMNPAVQPQKGAVQAHLPRETGEAMVACTQERDILLADFEKRKEELPEDVVAGVQGDLLVIDNAVAEIESALDADPENEQLQKMLIMTCEKQVGLLTRIVELANRA